MPSFLSACDVGLSFILSSFSKAGSSPTKVAEYLACGIPVVLNGDIGDQADLAADRDAAVVIESFAEAHLVAAADRALALAGRPLGERIAAGRAAARERFDLETVGVARYERLYRALGVRSR
jgi:glycosyltransferase involved in cell wall biosynthesis